MFFSAQANASRIECGQDCLLNEISSLGNSRVSKVVRCTVKVSFLHIVRLRNYDLQRENYDLLGETKS